MCDVFLILWPSQPSSGRYRSVRSRTSRFQGILNLLSSLSRVVCLCLWWVLFAVGCGWCQIRAQLSWLSCRNTLWWLMQRFFERLRSSKDAFGGNPTPRDSKKKFKKCIISAGSTLSTFSTVVLHLHILNAVSCSHCHSRNSHCKMEWLPDNLTTRCRSAVGEWAH